MTDWSEKIQQEKPSVFLYSEGGRPLKEHRDYRIEVTPNGNVIFALDIRLKDTKWPLILELLPNFKTKAELYNQKKQAWLKTQSRF